jgi:glycosyltransferase involved in cell wall biosynthesis
MFSSKPICSVVIANYNYAAYLPQAIESALSQDYPNIEIVVVDDGSTDDSPRVLERYASRITAVHKTNGGEASSRNAGYARCTGDVVIFLDADDFLLPGAVVRIVDKFEPGVVKVHYPLEIVDIEGHRTGQIMAGQLLSGDMGALLKEFGFYPSPPTSGNAYSRQVLERTMPIPERTFERKSDTYEIIMCALHGEVRAIREPCAAWRRHGSNMSRHDVSQLSAEIRRDIAAVELMNSFLREKGGAGPPREAAWPQHLQMRLKVAKLADERFAVSNDSVRSVLARYLMSVWQWPTYPVRKRVTATAWALTYAALPQSLVRGIWSDPTRLTSLLYPLIK